MQQKFLLRIGLVVEVVPGVEHVVAVEVVAGTVEVVGAGLQSQVHNGAGLPSIFCRRILLRVELLDSVDWQNRSRCSLHAFSVDDGRAVIRIIVVGAVDDEVVIFGTVSVGTDGKESATWAALHTRAKNYEILEVAPIQWKVVDRLVREGTAQSVIRRLYKRGLG